MRKSDIVVTHGRVSLGPAVTIRGATKTDPSLTSKTGKLEVRLGCIACAICDDHEECGYVLMYQDDGRCDLYLTHGSESLVGNLQSLSRVAWI